MAGAIFPFGLLRQVGGLFILHFRFVKHAAGLGPGDTPRGTRAEHCIPLTTAICCHTRMLIDLKPLEFALDDRVGDQPLTPDTVDLPTLRAFLGEVEALIKGNMASATLAESRVRIEDGSLKVVALVSALIAADVQADLSS